MRCLLTSRSWWHGVGRQYEGYADEKSVDVRAVVKVVTSWRCGALIFDRHVH